MQNFTNLCHNPDDLFLVVSEVTGDFCNTSILPINTKVLKFSNNVRPIFHVNGLKRLISVANVDLRPIESRMKEIDTIIIGCDGAVQRRIISKIRRLNPSVYVELWSDGLLEPHDANIIMRLRRKIEPLLAYLGFSWIMPSEVCTSSLVNKVHVLTESCKQSLLENGASGSKVYVSDFPRFKRYAEFNVPPSERNDRILIVVSAFSWHGRHDIEEWEIDLVRKISAYKKSVQIKIRPHPRSSQQLKDVIAASGIQSEFKDIFDDLSKSAVVVSFASTCLFDAIKLGCKVFVYEEGAPYINRGKFIESVPKLSDLNEFF